MERCLGQLRGAQFEHQRPHLGQRSPGQLAESLEPWTQRGILAGLAQQAVGGQCRGPQRLIDGIVQLARETLALLRSSQPRDLAGEPSIGDRRGCLIGDRPQTVAVAVREEPFHRALGDEEPDLLVTDPHRCADDGLGWAERPLRIIDDDRADSRTPTDR